MTAQVPRFRRGVIIHKVELGFRRCADGTAKASEREREAAAIVCIGRALVRSLICKESHQETHDPILLPTPYRLAASPRRTLPRRARAHHRWCRLHRLAPG